MPASSAHWPWPGRRPRKAWLPGAPVNPFPRAAPPPRTKPLAGPAPAPGGPRSRKPVHGSRVTSSSERPLRADVANSSRPPTPPRQGMVGAHHGHRHLGHDLAGRGQPQEPAAFVHGRPVVALGIHHGPVGPARVAGIARAPLRRLGREGMEHARAALGFAVRVAIPGAHRVGRGIGPVEPPAVRRPGQAVGGHHAIQHAAHHGRAGAAAAIDAVQRAHRLPRLPGRRLVQGSHPETAQRVAFAVIGALRGRVVGQRGHGHQGTCPVDAVAQRDHQRLAGHGPPVDAAGVGL